MQNQNVAEDLEPNESVSKTPAQPEEAKTSSIVTAGVIGSSSSGTSVAIAIMASLILNALMLMAYDHFMVKRFVSLDVKTFVEQQKNLYLAGKISDDQLRKNYETLGTAVKSMPKNYVIFMGDAVLGGVDKIELPQSGAN